jgi:hypothetical protein
MPPGLDEKNTFRLAMKVSELHEVAEWQGLGTQLHKSSYAHMLPATPHSRAPPGPAP